MKRIILLVVIVCTVVCCTDDVMQDNNYLLDLRKRDSIALIKKDSIHIKKDSTQNDAHIDSTKIKKSIPWTDLTPGIATPCGAHLDCPDIIIDRDKIISHGHEMLTQDDEWKEGMSFTSGFYDRTKYSFAAHKFFFVEWVDNTSLRIKNFLPHTFTDISIMYQKEGMSEAIEIAYIKEFLPYSEYTFSLRDLTKNTFRNRRRDKLITVEPETITETEANVYLFGNDDVLQRLQKITVHTELFFSYLNRGAHEHLDVEFARIYTPALANIYYVLSSSELHREIKNTPYDFIDEGKVIDGDEIVDKLCSIKKLGWGALAYSEEKPNRGGISYRSGHIAFRKYWLFINDDVKHNALWQTVRDTDMYCPFAIQMFTHEMAHIVQYHHDGNILYSQVKDGKEIGFAQVVIKVYQTMLRNKELPFNELPTLTRWYNLYIDW